MDKFPIEDSRFVNLAHHLSPAYVRVGGTSADCLFFNQTVPEGSKNLTNPVDGEDISNFTITDEDFLSIYRFTEKADLRMVFDLNVLIRGPDGNWDDSNARDIINFAKGHDMTMDWQLGNEPNSFRHVFGREVTAQQLARDYYHLRGVLNTSGFETSIIVGPESNHIGDANHRGEMYVKEFLENDGNSADYVTWHQYYLDGHVAQLKDFINPTTFNYLPMQIKSMNATINASGQRIRMWLSETSTAYGSGAPGLSDRFVAGFLWLDKLGYCAATGVDTVVRQSFFGGNYAMVGRDIIPNPDWWVSVLYKQFVSEKVLKLITANNYAQVRLYAHCTPESALITRVPAITIYGVNLDQAPAKVSIQGVHSVTSRSAKVFSYILTSDSLISSEIHMNGNILKLKADGSLPPFKPVISDLSQAVILPPYSMVFAVIHGLDVRACQS